LTALFEQALRQITTAAGHSFGARQRIAGATQQSTNFAGCRRPMNDRLEFDTVCPNNHNQTVTFSQKEFEESLKSDTLVFHCNTCDTNWPPSSEEIAKLRKHFSKDSS
jgi:hypothetical protein